MRSIKSEPVLYSGKEAVKSKSASAADGFTRQVKSENDVTDIVASKPRVSIAKKRSSGLRFDTAVRVILIPTRKEYRAAGLGDLLWWSDRDYNSFKGSAVMELRVILSLHDVDPKTALKRLYQPDCMFHEKANPPARVCAKTMSHSADSSASSSEALRLLSDSSSIRSGMSAVSGGSIKSQGSTDSEHSSFSSRSPSPSVRSPVSGASGKNTNTSFMSPARNKHELNASRDHVQSPASVFMSSENKNPFVKMLGQPSVTPVRWKPSSPAGSSGGQPKPLGLMCQY